MGLAALSSASKWRSAGVTVAVAATALYVATAAGHYDGKWLLNSPDEAATALATQRFAASGTLIVPTLGPWPAELQRPRSVQPTPVGWAPGSFIGLPVAYGAVAALLGLGGAMVFGAALAGFGVWLTYRLLSRVGGPAVGLVAAAATALSPAYWSAATHPLWQAAPTLVLVLLGAELLLSARRRSLLLLCSGLTLGFAVAVRSTEALWVVPALAVASWQLKLGRQLAWVVIGAALPLAAAAWLYAVTYTGAATPFAYDVTAALSSGGVFQLSLGATLRNVWLYLIQLQWWLVGLAAAGTWVTIKRAHSRALPLILVAAAMFAAQLVTYGGLTTFDSPGLPEPTIGNSHVRYWLPSYVLVAWLGSYATVWLWDTRRQKALAVTLGLAAALLSAETVLLSPGDGVLDVRRTLAAYGEERRIVLRAVPEGTLIVAGRSDKVLLGDRPLTFEVHPSQWLDVASGLRAGYRAAIYGSTVASLPAEATAAGIQLYSSQRTETGRYLSWLTVPQ